MLQVGHFTQETDPFKAAMCLGRVCRSFYFPHSNNFPTSWSQGRENKERRSWRVKSVVADHLHAWICKYLFFRTKIPQSERRKDGWEDSSSENRETFKEWGWLKIMVWKWPRMRIKGQPRPQGATSPKPGKNALGTRLDRGGVNKSSFPTCWSEMPQSSPLKRYPPQLYFFLLGVVRSLADILIISKKKPCIALS